MQYFEQELTFERATEYRDLQSRPTESELLGIRIRLGNRPLVKRLDNLTSDKISFPGLRIYSIVHAIGAIRLSGKAHVEELQYHAVFSEPEGLQTVDLIPNTRFKEVVNAGIKLEGGLKIDGNVETELPEELAKSLTNEYINIGADLKLQLSSEAHFAGKFTYNLSYPITQSIGIATNTCSWVLNPDAHKNDLLGDQLMVQFVALSENVEQLKMEVQGVVKADKGVLWKQKELKTANQLINIDIPESP